jgi:hypothetical protein
MTGLLEGGTGWEGKRTDYRASPSASEIGPSTGSTGEEILTRRRGSTPVNDSIDGEEEPIRPTELRSLQTERGRRPGNPGAQGTSLFTLG